MEFVVRFRDAFRHFTASHHYLECLWRSLLEFVARLRDACHHLTASHRIWSEFGVRYWNLLRDFGTLVVISPLRVVFGVLVVLEFCFVALESLVIDASEGDFVFSPCELIWVLGLLVSRRITRRRNSNKLNSRGEFWSLNVLRGPERQQLQKHTKNLERLCASSESVEPIENEIANLWAVLESCINIMDELQDVYSRSGEQENKDSVAVEAEGLESEINKVIETAEGFIKELVKKKQMASNNQTVLHTPPHMTGQSAYSPANSPSSSP